MLSALPRHVRLEPLRLSWSLGAWLPVLRHVPDRRKVALTFDDGPTPETTPALLDLLAARRATATFFLSGVRAAAHPELVAAIVAAGHDVYAHGWEHVYLTRFPRVRLRADMDRAEALLARFRSTPSPYMVRLPYNAGLRTPWVHRAIAAWRPDTQLVHWAISTEDVLIPGECADPSGLEPLAAARARHIVASDRIGGAILLLHEQPFDIPGTLNATVAPALLRHLLSALDAAGLATTRLSPIPAPNLLARCVLI